MSRTLAYAITAACLLSLTAEALAQIGPRGWWSETIGAGAVGDATIKGNTYTVTGDGADIWGNADGFHYLFKQLTGNGSLTARVVSTGSGSNAWSKGGVMIRATNAPGSKHAMMIISGGSGAGAAFQRRLSTNGTSTGNSNSAPAVAPPYWVKIERVGNAFSGYLAPDGKTWRQLGSAQTITMTDPVLIGLCATSHAAGELRTYTFDNVSWTGNVTDRPLQLQAWGPSPADGYVGVSLPLLQWKPGETAALHDVYFGASPELTATERRASQQPLPSYFHAQPLTPGTTYYWRVDEIEFDLTTVHTGAVWSFTVTPTTAWNPSPRHGSKWIDPNVTLTWAAGITGIKHEVYFGTDRDAVANRAASAFQVSQAPVSFTPGPLAPETVYYWAVDELDAGGATIPGEVWQFTTDSPGLAHGIRARYFAGIELTGAPLLTQIEPSVDHTWGSGEVIPGVSDLISARWTADLEIAVADTYTFITSSDDGVRLFLDGQRIINNWTNHSTTDDFSSPLALPPGLYALVLEWYESTGSATARLSWQSPFLARQIIPGGPLQPPARANGPFPASGDVNVPQEVTLRWSAGEQARQHDVYFGDDPNALAAATTDNTALYHGRQALDDDTFSPGALEWNKTYYWRVDEVNAVHPKSPWVGPVWHFTTANYLLVDDFESYNDEENQGTRIYETWIDGLTNGTTSTVGNWDPPFAERTIVHGGKQSMPFDYNNLLSPYYAEGEREFSPLMDWTTNEVTDLSLWYRGRPPAFYEAADGLIIMGGSGHDIWDNADDFRFAWKRLSGNGSITVKVESIANTNGWAKGGVMIRESLDAGSKFAYMIVSAIQGVSFGWRDTTDGTCGSRTQAGVAAPQWVKLTRTGDVFTAQYSADGTTWSDVKNADGTVTSTTVTMTGSVYIGLCVTSHTATAITSAGFTGPSTTGSVTGPWQVTAIGDDPQPANAPDRLYVVVEDSAGKTKIVTHPDPTAVLTTTWTEWKIPLTDFAPVSLSKVKRLYIGVGDRNAKVPTGGGRLYIDDIRVTKPAP